MTIKAKEWVYKMEQYVKPETRGFGIKLDFNENTLGPSPLVIKALKNIGAENICQYPEYGELTEKISQYVKAKPEQIIPTNGSDESIKLVFDCFVSPQDEVVIPTPSFSMFYVFAKSAGAKTIEVLYNNDFSFPTKQVLEAVTDKTRLVIICSPNNPTGTSITEKDLRKILWKSKNAPVLLDEAYYEFSQKSLAGLVCEFENLIVTRTFSKAFGLAALRIGYIIAREETASLLRKICPPFTVNYMARLAAETALSDTKYVEQYVKEIRQNKTVFEKFLKSLGINFIKSDANFLLVDFKKAHKFVSKSLESKGILVKDRSKEALLEGFVRITVGDKAKNEKLMLELKKILEKPLIVFDLDGVLVDVSKSYRIAVKKTVEFFSKKDLPLEEIQEWKNRTGINNDWELSKKILEARNVAVELDKISGKFQGFYLGKNFDGLIRNEKLRIDKKLLDELFRDYCLAIFTGRPRKEAEFVLDFFGITEHFSEIICMEDLPKDRQKPSPLGLEIIKSNTNFSKAVYFGDTVSDMLAASAAKNVLAVGVMPNGVFSEKTLNSLKNAGAKKVLNNINELEVVLNEKSSN